MWIRFWSRVNCPGPGAPYQSYVECPDEWDDEELEGEALSRVHPHVDKYTERGFSYGFERLPEGLPEEARQAMIRGCRREIESAVQRLRGLLG